MNARPFFICYELPVSTWSSQGGQIPSPRDTNILIFDVTIGMSF